MRLLTEKEAKVILDLPLGIMSEEDRDCLISSSFSVECPHCKERQWGIGDTPVVCLGIKCNDCDKLFHITRSGRYDSVQEIIEKLYD